MDLLPREGRLLEREGRRVLLRQNLGPGLRLRVLIFTVGCGNPVGALG
jgi:hypothetical protein